MWCALAPQSTCRHDATQIGTITPGGNSLYYVQYTTTGSGWRSLGISVRPFSLRRRRGATPRLTTPNTLPRAAVPPVSGLAQINGAPINGSPYSIYVAPSDAAVGVIVAVVLLVVSFSLIIGYIVYKRKQVRQCSRWMPAWETRTRSNTTWASFDAAAKLVCSRTTAAD